MPSFRVEIGGGVATLTFDDGAMNLLSESALRELLNSMEQLPPLQALVLRSGRDRIFAAGADMSAMQAFDGRAALAFAELGQTVFGVIESLPCVTIALIDGDCYGGALDLALAFDVRLCTARSRFAHPGSRIGIVTGFGGTHRVPRLRSRRLTSSLMLDNSVLSSADAVERGLVDATCEDVPACELMLEQIVRERALDGVIAKTLVRASVRGGAERRVLARRTEELWRGINDDGRP